jgi:glycosyltransferase involved in cell wall biosynthesis
MKVLHVIASLRASHGGPSRSVASLAGALADRGVACSILHWDPSATEPEEVAMAMKKGVTIDRVPSWSNCDVVHLHGLWSFGLHRLEAQALARQIQVVISPRGMLEPWARRHHRWRKEAAWRLYQKRDLERARVLHATSEQERDSFAELGFSKTVVVPNGAEIPAQTARFESPRRIVFLSRIHPKKGLVLLVDAAARIALDLRRSQWSIVIAGPDEGGHAAEVRRAIAQRGVSDLFAFAGEVDGEPKRALLRSAHLFILPSYSENFGIVVAEALAAGVPVITTTGTPWRQLEEHRCGWWVAPDAGAIAGALRSAIGLQPEELRAMGLRGRELVSSGYSWAMAAQRFVSVYNGLLGGSRVG